MLILTNLTSALVVRVCLVYHWDKSLQDFSGVHQALQNLTMSKLLGDRIATAEIIADIAILLRRVILFKENHPGVRELRNSVLNTLDVILQARATPSKLNA